ncbi:MAG: hypothetical protein IPJ46_09415 [Anaerolineales bacterium]|nr:hypothetical protein [Anaerolineales bacterium]
MANDVDGARDVITIGKTGYLVTPTSTAGNGLIEFNLLNDENYVIRWALLQSDMPAVFQRRHD